MANLSLIVFDDLVAQKWEPFALTRPIGELLFGTLTLRERAERVLGARCLMHLAPEHLVGFDEEGSPPVARYEDAPESGDRLFWLSRAAPGWDARAALEGALITAGPILVEDAVAGWYAPAGTPAPPADFFLDPDRFADAVPGGLRIRLPGHALARVWELISGNADQTALDIEALFPAPPVADLGPGVYQWGKHPIIVGGSVRLEPGCVFDTSEGPIWLAERSVVRAFTRVCGPTYLGPHSALLGGSIECASIGPVSKIRGEFASSVCLGYANKQHDGHIGHAYLGRWVNLGAETTNSDLKNNYGTIRLWTPDGEVDTGEIKLGSLLGDHVKTGIGLLLNTGTVVGAGSNLYGADMPPKYVPPFSWGSGDELVEYRADKFLEVAERAMSRRDVTLSESQREQLRRAWARARGGGEPDRTPRG
jgi:UDP-N-acetylglucosamine diphosphorylase / glucose-1-phosphate thymidylyltransferase / UDP-N-acetylgalactosamine diphosphorylase / glucosamine-1-phosphate N-acetyltransferase / galactosamine-1-phosphate N-acetyltransferase